jgi:hypothetical protein
VAKTFEPNQISSSTSAAATALGPSTWYPLNATTQATYDTVYNALAGYFGAGQLNYGATDRLSLALHGLRAPPDRDHHQVLPLRGRHRVAWSATGTTTSA